MALKKKSGRLDGGAWNTGLEVGQTGRVYASSSEANSTSPCGPWVSPGLRDLALFSVAIDTHAAGGPNLRLSDC